MDLTCSYIPGDTWTSLFMILSVHQQCLMLCQCMANKLPSLYGSHDSLAEWWYVHAGPSSSLPELTRQPAAICHLTVAISLMMPCPCRSTKHRCSPHTKFLGPTQGDSPSAVISICTNGRTAAEVCAHASMVWSAAGSSYAESTASNR